MAPDDLYFKISAQIWTAYFETRAGKRFGESALSMAKRDELLNELRSTIKFRESKVNDKELMRRIEEKRKQSLATDVKDAFK